MHDIDLKSAKDKNWDVVIVGSSFSAMFFLRGLPEKLSVLIIEKGQRIAHTEILQRGLPGEIIRQRNFSAHDKTWVANTLLGGNSNCWWGCTPRFHPSDFRLNTLYGVGEDWPLDYEALSPFYDEVETAMEISGGGSDHLLPRQRPFPFPPHHPSRSDVTLRNSSKNWFAQPTARSNGGSRPICCANGVCSICPIDAKFTITNGMQALDHPGASLLLDTEVRAVKIEAGRATGVSVRSDSSDAEISTNIVALAANAVFNATIMKRSGMSQPALGSYLHEQVSRTIEIDSTIENLLGGTSITGHGYDLYDGAHRSRHGGVIIENWNSPPILRPERDRWFQRLRFKLIAEDLPQERNHIELEDDEPVIFWHGHADYGVQGLEWAISQLPTLLPVPIEKMTIGELSTTEAHIQGTHRMGTDPQSSVVDHKLKCHEVKNLLALGAGSFPTCSPANPTLTLSALALRAGRLL